MAETFFKVIDPDGVSRLVPDNKPNRKMIEKLNALIRKGNRYKILPYDPNNPDAGEEPAVSTTDAIGKLALENQQMKRKIEEMEKALAAKTPEKAAPVSPKSNKP
jgi:hypothetical protein